MIQGMIADFMSLLQDHFAAAGWLFSHVPVRKKSGLNTFFLQSLQKLFQALAAPEGFKRKGRGRRLPGA